MTRRNSTTGVATPVKTPAKRGAASSTTIVENTETVTPARRSTRRRSVSVFENEDANQTVLKTPAFSAVNEETTLTTTRVTRSQSKSPQQIKLQQTTAATTSPKRTKSPKTTSPSPKRTKSPKTTSPSPKLTGSNQKRRKPGPKSKTRENNEQENDSDVEISVLGNEMENIKNKSKSIPTIILTDDESNQTTKTNEDEDKTSQQNKNIDEKKVSNIPDGDVLNKTSEAEKEKSVTMKVVDQTDNTNMNVGEVEKEKSDTMEVVDQLDNTNKEAAEVEKEKSVTMKVVDQEQAVDANIPDEEILNKTEIQTDDKNMDVEVEKEKPESILENLESESTTMHELRVDEDTTESTESNNISLKLTETEELLDEKINQNEEMESKISSQADNIENTDVEHQNDHPMEENELNQTTAQTVTTESSDSHDDAGEQNKALDNKIDQTESVEKKTSLGTEIIDTNDDKDSNLHLENEAKFNESVKNVTTEKEKNNTTDTPDTVAEENILANEKCDETRNEKDIHTNANENIESMEVDEDDDVIVNNTLNAQDSNDVKSEQETELNSSTIQILDSTDNKLNVENPSTPKSKEKSSDKIEIISVSTLTPYRKNDVEDANESVVKGPSKKVEFNASPSNDMTIKNVYPKTPASAKISNSFIEINSSPDDGSFHAEIKQELEDNNVESSSQVDQKMTPIRGFKLKRSLETVQSSTPINVEALKPEVESEPEKEASLKDDQSKEEEMKWINPSVKGTTTEGSKLDAVVTSRNDTSASKVIEINESIVQTHKKKSIIFSSEDEEEDNEHLEREDDDQEAEEELAEGEKPYKRKHDFHDDEAMEVDGYESGDSMDSEERREIEENEIPVDGESIGSHTTEDENDESVEEEESDNADSFIVSDNEEVLEQSDSNEEDDLLDGEEEHNDHNRKKKKTYKRLQRPADSSSSEDEEEEKEKVEQHEEVKSAEGDSNNDKQLEFPKESPISQPEDKKAKEIKSDLESFNKSNENMLDTSKLSDSALRLQCTAESESEDEDVNTANEEIMNISRKEILRKLNQSDRFNKSVRDLNPEVDTSSPADNCENDSNEKETADDQDEEEGEEEHSTTTSSEDSVHNSKSNIRRKQSESHLGEVSVTSESDGDKENQHHSLRLPQKHKLLETGLSVSFGNYKKPKSITKGRQEWQRSFTIDVSVKDGDLKTEITDIKQSEGIPTSSDTSTTSNDERENVGLQSEDINYLENIRHMPLPLGNPLIRTRRQSLALPTNPDMEICSSSHGASGITGKKLKRKSLGVLSNSEFNPSQSFIDSIELQKSELVRQMGKRKRLSKSFCGAAESLDSSIIDIDVRHLHKRSKLLSENSMAESHHDSMENMNTSKISTKHSSTPHQKKLNENDSNNNIQHILNRCDEILEAANRAKLEAKLNNKKVIF